MLKTKQLTMLAQNGGSDLDLEFIDNGPCVVKSFGKVVFTGKRSAAVKFFNRRVRHWLRSDGRKVPKSKHDYNYIPE